VSRISPESLMKTPEVGRDAHPTAGETPALRKPGASPLTPKNASAPDRSAGVAPAVAGASRPRSPLWATVVATFFGVGHLRPGPGTWGSAATVLLWWLLGRWIAPGWEPWTPALLALAAVLIGIPAATQVARASNRKDPQFVVIDEVAGQLITLIAAPIAWQSLLLGFILFRAFDIVKPPPVRQLERLPEGVGIVIDDVGAGLYGLAVMQVVLHFGLLPR
jgi:phosphatidylglycerophosphatase A